MIATSAALTAAKDRAVVTLADGRTARLVYWPIPPGERNKRTGRPRSGAKAKVVMAGSYVSVPPEAVVAVAESAPA